MTHSILVLQRTYTGAGDARIVCRLSSMDPFKVLIGRIIVFSLQLGELIVVHSSLTVSQGQSRSNGLRVCAWRRVPLGKSRLPWETITAMAIARPSTPVRTSYQQQV
jgi:hypothetical protein